jgi:hypothetical protein
VAKMCMRDKYTAGNMDFEINNKQLLFNNKKAYSQSFKFYETEKWLKQKFV